MEESELFTNRRSNLVLFALFLPACLPGMDVPWNNGAPDAGTIDVTPPPPAEPPPPPAIAAYRRGSLQVPYQLLPRAEYGRVAEDGVSFVDADYTVAQPPALSAAQKLDELGSILGGDRPIDLMPSSA